MTLFGGFEREERIDHFGMRFRVGPVPGDAGPLRAEAFLVGVGVLDDQRLQPLRMGQDHAKADRRAIVVKVEGVVADLELVEQLSIVWARWSKVYA